MKYKDIKSNKLTNLVHTIVLILALAAVLGFLGWMITGIDGVVFAITFFIISLLFTPKVPVHLVMRAYGAKRLRTGSVPQLHDITMTLSKNAELKRMPTLYYSPSRVLNAFAAGSKDNSGILITQGLLNTLNASEMAGIIGHEITHIKNNDLKVMWIANLFSRLTGFISFVGQMLILLSLPFLLVSDVNIPFLPFLLLIFSPTLSLLLNLALSRTREFDADLGSAVLTGNPNFLASALTKLEHYKRNPWTNFFMARPMNQQVDFLSTHPATTERISKLLSFSAESNPDILRSYLYRIPTGLNIF